PFFAIYSDFSLFIAIFSIYSDSLKGKWNNLTSGSKAAILATILICLILIAIFVTIIIASSSSSSQLTSHLLEWDSTLAKN
uniref:Uncharacterized protein n=1 Tax=Romanomermis culicivorax TaxID=13658 RepID=A0A915KBI6_ROMCU